MLRCLPLSCACVYVGVPHVLLCPNPRRDSAGKPACELCGRRLSTCKGKLYQHETGKICQSCYKIREGHQAPPAVFSPYPPSRSHNCLSSLSPSSRTKRPYDTL